MVRSKRFVRNSTSWSPVCKRRRQSKPATPYSPQLEGNSVLSLKHERLLMCVVNANSSRSRAAGWGREFALRR